MRRQEADADDQHVRVPPVAAVEARSARPEVRQDDRCFESGSVVRLAGEQVPTQPADDDGSTAQAAARLGDFPDPGGAEPGAEDAAEADVTPMAGCVTVDDRT